MRVLVMVSVLTACAADPPTIEPVEDSRQLTQIDRELATEQSIAAVVSTEPDVCGLAAELPPDNLCSMICDPVALEDALIEAGVESGRCYLLLCALTEDCTVSVGVCLN